VYSQVFDFGGGAILKGNFYDSGIWSWGENRNELGDM